MFDCPCGKGSRAIYFCDRKCVKNTHYYCSLCSDPHDHKITLIAQGTNENNNFCRNLYSEFNNAYKLISAKEAQFKEFLEVG